MKTINFVCRLWNDDNYKFSIPAVVELSDYAIREITKHIKAGDPSGRILHLPEKIVKRFEGASLDAMQNTSYGLDYFYEEGLILTPQIYFPQDLLDCLKEDVKALLPMEQIVADNAKMEEVLESEYAEDLDDQHEWACYEQEDSELPVVCEQEEGCEVCEPEEDCEVCESEEETECLESEEDDDTDYCMEYLNEDGSYRLLGEEKPTKENTLYLTIKQKYFDEIMDGTKTVEYRELKGTTYKKFLEVEDDDNPAVNKDLVTVPFSVDDEFLFAWNEGVCPYFPKMSLRYLSLAVGYNKQRDTALVELAGFRFSPTQLPNGGIARFDDPEGVLVFGPNGKHCFWNIELLIKRVLKVHRH